MTENLETIRRIDDAFTAGVERGEFEAAFDTGAVAADFEGYSIQREELIDVGKDRVVGVLKQFATGRGSGAQVELELEYSLVYDLRDGQLVRIRAFLDRAEALEAARVQE